MKAEEIMQMLGLTPHPEEGGFFAETYRCEESIEPGALANRYGGARSHGTAIYYMLTENSISAMHRLESDEVFHFYLGDPVQMLHLMPGGEIRTPMLGGDLKAGMRPQIVVPRGAWQGARLAEGGSFALIGCTLAPGFDYVDYEHGHRDELLAAYEDARDEIMRLTAG